MHAPRRLPAVALAALAAAVAGGCGGGSSSGNGVASKAPAEILAATKAAADAANSVHVSGSIVSGGTPIALDMELLRGKGGKGRLSENGLSFELIETGGTVYIKGSPAFYSHFGGAAAQLLQGKWLKAPANSSSFGSLASLTELGKLLDSALASHGTLVKGPSTTAEGQQVVGVTEASQGATLYVATTGQPYPVEIVKSGADAGKVAFDKWNQPVSLTAPASAVDITKLQSGG